MARRLAEVDWSVHPLGPVHRWPESLRTLVNLVLGSPQAMWLGWGRGLHVFAGEACARLAGWPRGMRPGTPAREVWAEHWDEFGPALSSGIAAGAAWRLALPPGRAKQHGAAFWCSPVTAGGDAVAGVLAIATADAADGEGDEASREAEEENLLQAIVGVSDFVGVFDREWRCVHIDPRVLVLDGRPGEDLRGRVLWQAFPAIVGTPLERELRAAAAARMPRRLEYRHPTWRRWFDCTICPGRDGVRLFARDITESKAATEALGTSEERFAQFMDHLPGLAWIKDVDGRYVYANSAAARVFGREPGEVLGQTDAELFPPGTAERFRANDALARASENGIQTTETLRHPDDGRVHHAIVSKFPIPAGAGAAPFVGGMAIDITERREAETALQRAHGRLEERVRERTSELAQTNARFQAIYDQGLFSGLIALDGTLVDVSRSWLEATGFAAAEVLRRPIWEAGWWAGAPETRASIEQGFAQAVKGATFHGETACFTADGRERRLDFALIPIRQDAGDIGFIVPAGFDITERRRAELSLQAAEVARETDTRFRRLADNAPVLVWMADADNAATWFNQQWLDFTGRPLERELGPGWLESVHPDDVGNCAEVRAQAFAARRPFEIEYRLRRRDGEYRWMLDHGAPGFAADGTFTGHTGSCVDISERKQAELAMQRFAAIVESSEDAIISKDLSGIIMSWNPAAERLFGYSAEEIIGRPILDLIPEDRRSEEPRILERIRRGEPVQHYETRRQRKDGTIFDTSLSISPVKDRSGRIVGAAKILRDITGRKRTEAELLRRERLYRAIGESIDYGIWVCDAAGRSVYTSESFLRLVGATQAGCAGFGWRDHLHPDEAGATIAAWQECVRRGDFWEREHRVRGVDGSWHPILARGVPVRDESGTIVSWAGINLDISRLKRNEEALQRKTRNLEVLNRVGRALAAERDLEAVVRAVTGAGCEVSGADCGAFFQNVHEAGAASYRLSATCGARAEELARLGVPHLAGLFAATGHERSVVRLGDVLRDPRVGAAEQPAPALRSYLAVPVVSHSGAVHGGLFYGHAEPEVFNEEAEMLVMAIAAQAAVAIDGANLYRAMQRELREHERAEHALRESEERFRTLADNIAAFAWTADPYGWIFWYNRRWLEYTGATLAEMEGWGWRSVHHPDHAARVVEKYSRCIASGEAWEDTFPLRRHDGVYRWFLSRAVPIRDATGRVVRWFGTNTDITEQREVELALERARDEAVAASRAKDDFLATLSHELRTPLNPVLLLASDAAANASLPEPVRADFETIRKNVSLEARLIDDLLDLTRISRGKLLLDFETHDVHAIVRDAIANIRSGAAEQGVALSLDLQATGHHVRADAVRLQQVFWNLLKNAVKFTPAGGRIELASRTPPDGRQIEIVVSDTGIGMTAAELPRIFDAFSQGDHATADGLRRFGGLGIGLTISHRVVEMHQGTIRAASPGPGRGATFVVSLPAVEAAPASAPPAGAVRPAGAPREGGRILLVEDHAATRAALARLLVRRQFTVAAAATVAEARALLRERQFDLLISDVGLPDGNGCDLMRLCARDHKLPGIALTGYGMEQDVARSRDAGFSAHLTKPVSVSALDRAIAAALLPTAP